MCKVAQKFAIAKELLRFHSPTTGPTWVAAGPQRTSSSLGTPGLTGSPEVPFCCREEPCRNGQSSAYASKLEIIMYVHQLFGQHVMLSSD